jgi:alpha-mannosidase
VPRVAAALNQPLRAFQVDAHAGRLGRSLSLLSVSSAQVGVQAVKLAEASREVVVRLQEQHGRAASGVRLRFAVPVTAAREINAAEEPIGEASVLTGALVTDFGPYQPRTFALTIAPPPASGRRPRSTPVRLPHDVVAWTRDGERRAGGFDGAGRGLPAELQPSDLAYAGVQFQLAPSAGDAPNALVPRGQVVPLPPGAQGRLYVLAASVAGDRDVTLRAGTTPVTVRVQDWGGFVGQWDTRRWEPREELAPPEPGAPPGQPLRTQTLPHYAGLTPGYIKRAPVAWFASHRHAADGTNEPYAYAYLFAYAVDLPPGASSVTLPTDDAVRILAMTVSDEPAGVAPAWPLYDTLVR